MKFTITKVGEEGYEPRLTFQLGDEIFEPDYHLSSRLTDTTDESRNGIFETTAYDLWFYRGRAKVAVTFEDLDWDLDPEELMSAIMVRVKQVKDAFAAKYPAVDLSNSCEV